MTCLTRLAALVLAAGSLTSVGAQQPRPLMPIELRNSAESRWLEKKVQASRVLDDMTRPDTWRMTGTGSLTRPPEPTLGDMRVIARRRLPRMFFDVVDGGAGAENTLPASVSNLARVTLRPRSLVDVSKPSLSTSSVG